MGKFHKKVGSAHFHVLSAHMSALAIILLPPYDEYQTQNMKEILLKLLYYWYHILLLSLISPLLSPTKQPMSLPTTAPTSNPTD